MMSNDDKEMTNYSLCAAQEIRKKMAAERREKDAAILLNVTWPSDDRF